MKKLFFVFMICFTFVSFIFNTAASAAPQAICVPWQPSDSSAPHYAYDGAEITLKGIARGGGTEYRWDFGDGGSTDWAPIADAYNLGVKHVYNGTAGQLFIATLYVRDDSLAESQDNYPIKIHESSDLGNPNHLDVRIHIAIDEGLWWLHTNMIRGAYPAGSPGYEQPWGYWDPSYYPLAATGAAVDAFQLHGSKANKDYDSDPYVETVQRALNVLLYNTYGFAIGPQPAGNPDTNGNGIGLVTNVSSSIVDTRQTYIGGICLTALASSGAPNRVAAIGRANVYGRTYAEIVQDMVDFFAWGQVDANWGRGGWRYYANYSNSDMSTTQWPPLGMIAAEENMGSIVPQFVRDELSLYLDVAQNAALNNDNGGFAYGTSYTYPQYYNLTKAAAGIIAHEFLGTPLADPKVQSALGFIYRHWDDSGTSWWYTELHGNTYGMYGIMKAFRIPEPDMTQVPEYDYVNGVQTGNSFDWFYTPAGQTQQGLASYNVSTQQPDGSWDDTVGSNPLYNAFATGWRIMVLLKGVTVIPPVAVICDCDEQEYNLDQDIHLDASCSTHPDTNRSIVSYEWDFDYDGNFVPDDSGLEAVIEGGYADTGYYPVALRVTDDNPEKPQTDIHVCEIYVHPPPHCPHANAGGPYIGFIGEPVFFDASGSWDPDNEIVSYEWDLDYDALFGADDNDCFGKPSDAVGIYTQWTWNEPYTGVIGLKVTDAAGEFEACFDLDCTTIDIGNHPPEADPGGPYLALPGTTIILDGTASSDPDQGDSITCAWDLDNDGDFDDSFDCQTEFTVGPDIGTSYDICYKVTDSFGEYDITCTTIEIVPNLPPVAVIAPIDDAVVPLPVTVNVTPGTLSLSRLGGWVKAHICADVETSQEMEVALDGSGSNDPDEDPITYDWTLIGPEGENEVEDIMTTTIVLPAGSYSLTLLVNDGTANSDPATDTFDLTDQTVDDLMAGSYTLNGVPQANVKPSGECVDVAFDKASIAATVEVGMEVEMVLEGSASSKDYITVIE